MESNNKILIVETQPTCFAKCLSKVLGLWGFETESVVPQMADYLGEVRHQYTHFKLVCKVYALKDSTAEQTFDLSEIEALAISKVDEKIIALWQSVKIE